MTHFDALIEKHMSKLPRMGEHLTARVHEAMEGAVQEATSRMLHSDVESHQLVTSIIESLPLTMDET